MISRALPTPDRMRAPLPLEQDLLRVDVDAELEEEGVTLVRAQAGMHISELNAHLERLGLGLPNMGGFDGQTIADDLGHRRLHRELGADFVHSMAHGVGDPAYQPRHVETLR